MRFFPHNNTSTLDIYFFEPLKDLISEWPHRGSGKRPIRRLGPNSFVCRGHGVIIRYATQGELSALRACNLKSCTYLIDDDLNAVETDTSLPYDYRARLLEFKRQCWPEILELCDTVVAPNALILKTFPGHEQCLLNPSYTSVCRDFSHFETASTVDIVFCGTRSHLHDLGLLSEVMAGICEDYSQVRFTTFLGGHAPDALKGFGNIIHHRPECWRAFKKILARDRFHIAIAPLQDTPFNRARSINKIFDHAAFGAAGLYSDMSPITGTVEHGHDGLLVKNQAEAWRLTIEGLIRERDTACRLAKAGCALASTVGGPDTVRDFWMARILDR